MEVLDIVKDALKNEEFKELLKGEKKYLIEDDIVSKFNNPTNYRKILKEGIFNIYINEDKEILKKFENTLVDLLNGDLLERYSAIEIIFYYLLSDNFKLAPFKINDEIISMIAERLTEKKEEFNICFKWAGFKNKNGLWDEVLRISNICREEFNVDIGIY